MAVAVPGRTDLGGTRVAPQVARVDLSMVVTAGVLRGVRSLPTETLVIHSGAVVAVRVVVAAAMRATLRAGRAATVRFGSPTLLSRMV